MYKMMCIPTFLRMLEGTVSFISILSQSPLCYEHVLGTCNGGFDSINFPVAGNRQYTDDNGNEYGIKTAGSTLHFGSDDRHNKWPTAHGEK